MEGWGMKNFGQTFSHENGRIRGPVKTLN